MKITKQSSLSSNTRSQASYLIAIDNDLVNIFNVFKGRVRLGDCKDGSRGENISGEFKVFTSHVTPNTEFAVTHNLGTIPLGWIIINKDKAGDLYKSSTTWTDTTIYFKCSVASVTFTIFLLV